MEFHFCLAHAPRQLPWVGTVPTSRDQHPSFGGAHPGAVLVAGRDKGLYEEGCALGCLPCADGALVTHLVYLGWSSDGHPGVTTSRPLDSLLFSGGTRALSPLGSSRVHHLVSVQMLSFLANRLHSPRVFGSFTRPAGSSFSPAFLRPSRAQAFPSCKVCLSSGQTPALNSAALPRPEVVRMQ